jgi:hypothetical protein
MPCQISGERSTARSGRDWQAGLEWVPGRVRTLDYLQRNGYSSLAITIPTTSLSIYSNAIVSICTIGSIFTCSARDSLRPFPKGGFHCTFTKSATSYFV